MTDLSVIIVAGGKGLRMGNDLPKQFLKLGQVPLLMHTINRFYAFDSSVQIILVLNKDYIDYWNVLKKEYNFNVPHIVTGGGKERFHSVKNGLDLAVGRFIAVHDAVRPFVPCDMIERGLTKAKKYESAVPYILPKDSYRIVDGTGNKHIDRSKLRIIQTPQIFASKVIKDAYEQDFSGLFTDDASVVEAAGHKIWLYQGCEYNLKITTPFDLKVASLILPEFSEKFSC